MKNYNFACGSVSVWNLVSDIKGEHRLRMFENRVLRKIFGPKKMNDRKFENTA
jgi:hypothetical protein